MQKRNKIKIEIKTKRSRVLDILLLLVITTVIVVVFTLARYSSTLGRKSNIQLIANPELNMTTIADITLLDMVPGDVKTYNFAVNNYSDEAGESVSDTAMKYVLEFETGNYLPINLELYAVENGILQSENLLSGTNVIDEQILGIERESDFYELKITWTPTENSYLYSDEIDFVKIKLYSEQVSPQ